MRMPPFDVRWRTAGFTVVEMVVSMGASVVVIGGLMMSSLSLQKSLTGSERYATAYSDQRRLIDFIGRDLRRSVAVEATDSAGNRISATGQAVQIEGRGTLILSLPAYYRSNTRSASDFDQPLDVVGTEERLDYGTTTTGLAPAVEVSFRKVYVGKERCTCFVRQEAGNDEVIVRAADRLFAEVSVFSSAQSAVLHAWFAAPYSQAAPLVSTYDRLLLRNPPLTMKP